MEAYLDNSATTCVYQETADLVCDLMVNHYGNPSAMHQKGVEAEQYIRTAQETLAKILKVKEKEIFFTSGGTESDNWALVGTVLLSQSRRSDEESRRKIRKRIFMSMRSRRSANTGFIRNGWASTCSP